MDGLFFGGGFKLLGLQMLAVLVTMIWAGAVTYAIAKVVDRMVGLRVSTQMVSQKIGNVVTSVYLKIFNVIL